MLGEDARRLFQPRASDAHGDPIEEQLARRRKQSRVERRTSTCNNSFANARGQTGGHNTHAAANSFMT
jgi:hypothetical protein